MIEATQKKLRETLFFLNLLNQETGKVLRNEPEAVQYFLSAFLSAGRSVTWALQWEEKERYDAWFPTWFDSRTQEERDLFDFLKTQRNNEHKRGGSEVEASYEYVSVTEIQMGNAGHPAYGFFWSGVPGAPPPRVGRPAHHFRLGGSDAEVAQACARYAALLGQLVQEFIREHAGC